MIGRSILIALAGLLVAGSAAAQNCEYKAGETKFADYANCRYGADAVVIIDLPEKDNWEKCIYLAEAFRPAKLLAVTRDENGKEKVSVNDRAQIGNPCYLTKQSCDKALKAARQ